MVVRDIGVGEVLELLFVRRLLESEAAALAVGRIPVARLQALREQLANSPNGGSEDEAQSWRAGDDVHEVISEYCGNKSLKSMIEDARRRIRVSNIERVPGREDHALREHMAIVDALAAGDKKAVHAAVVAHLDNLRDEFLAAFGVPNNHE
jgi:DNA-binding GntR family transcriptional regulator